MIKNNTEDIIWEDVYVPYGDIIKGLIISVPFLLFPLLFIFTPRFFSALLITSIIMIIMLPFTIAYLDSKLYISIRLTNSSFYIKRTFIRKTRKFNLNEVTQIIISIADINSYKKFAPLRFTIKIITMFGEKKYKFIQMLSFPKKRHCPLEEKIKMRIKFKKEINNLTNLFPKLIYVEEKAPIEKIKRYFNSYLKINI